MPGDHVPVEMGGVPVVFLIGVLASLAAMLAAPCAYRNAIDTPRARCSRNH